MRKIKRVMFLFLTAAVLACALPGCGKSNGGGRPAENGTEPESAVKDASGTEPESAAKDASGTKHMKLASTGYFKTSSADPGADYNGWYESFMGIVENLYRLDENMSPQPYLAESGENIDSLTWRFTLKDDVTFHNGVKMTAEQVKLCFERTMEVNARGISQIPIESIQADGQALTIKTASPVPTMISDLCDPLWAVYYVGDDCAYETMAYGTGPFAITEYRQGIKTSVKAYEKYWGGKAKIDTADFLTVGDNDALTMAMQSEEVDLVVNPSASALPLFSDTSKYVLDMVTGNRATTLHFNLEHDCVKDPAVRNAISMCVDRASYCNVIVNGTAEPSYGIFPKAMTGGGTDGLKLTVEQFDPKGAAKLLADAGYTDSDGDGVLDKNGLKLEMSVITSASRKELGSLCDAVQSQLGEIGVKLNIQVLENTSDAQASGDFDICVSSFNMSPTGNPTYFLNNRIVKGASGNSGHYYNEKVEELVLALNGEFDGQKRDQLTKEICQELVNDSYYLVIAHQKFLTVYSTAVKNFKTHPCEYYLMDNQIDLVR